MLTAYFSNYFLQLSYGPGYVLTSVILAAGAVAIFFRRKGKGAMRGDAARFALLTFILWAAGLAFDSVYYAFVPGVFLMDDFRLMVILTVSVLLQRDWTWRTRVLRCSVFFGCMQLALPISEPFGDLITSVNEAFLWGNGVTPLVMAILCAATVIYLRRLSVEAFTELPASLTLIIVVVAYVGWIIWRLCLYYNPGRMFSFILAFLAWGEIWLFYYVFYVAARKNQENMELQAIQQKSQLDAELLDLTRQTYDDLHKTRHELKNHLIYLKMLAYHEEWDKLWNYLNTLSGETEEMFTYVECGNEVVNAVLNHAVGKARKQGIRLETNLVVPPSLPYDEVELCSLLSNLANNAIEAAAPLAYSQTKMAGEAAAGQVPETPARISPSDLKSESNPSPGQETPDKDSSMLKQQALPPSPVIRYSIYPQQDYLFIKVENPFVPSVSRERRLSLRTTKKDARYHGYGTKVIRQIATKYNGSASFAIEEDQFVATVMLDLDVSKPQAMRPAS